MNVLVYLKSTYCSYCLYTNAPVYCPTPSLFITTNTGARQDCILSAYLYTLLHKLPSQPVTKYFKYSDTSVIALLLHQDSVAANKHSKSQWCKENHLLLTITKTKKLIFDYRLKRPSSLEPRDIDNQPVEIVASFKSQGCHTLLDNK